MCVSRLGGEGGERILREDSSELRGRPMEGGRRGRGLRTEGEERTYRHLLARNITAQMGLESRDVGADETKLGDKGRRWVYARRGDGKEKRDVRARRDEESSGAKKTVECEIFSLTTH